MQAASSPKPRMTPSMALLVDAHRRPTISSSPSRRRATASVTPRTGIGNPRSSTDALSSSSSSSRSSSADRTASASSTSASISARISASSSDTASAPGSVRGRGSSGSRTARAPPSVEQVAVATGTQVPLGVERLAAQRARRPAGGDDPQGAHDELADRGGGQPDPHQVGPVFVVVVGERLLLALLLALGLLLGVLVRFGQLEGNGDDPCPVAGLEEEGPVARGAHGPGDEPVGGLEEVATSRHRHRGYRNPA